TARTTPPRVVNWVLRWRTSRRGFTVGESLQETPRAAQDGPPGAAPDRARGAGGRPPGPVPGCGCGRPVRRAAAPPTAGCTWRSDARSSSRPVGRAAAPATAEWGSGRPAARAPPTRGRSGGWRGHGGLVSWRTAAPDAAGLRAGAGGAKRRAAGGRRGHGRAAQRVL